MDEIKDCKNRGAVLDGKKCFCTPWNRWTNCLEVGYCVRRSWAKRGQPSGQLELDFEREDDECRDES